MANGISFQGYRIPTKHLAKVYLIPSRFTPVSPVIVSTHSISIGTRFELDLKAGILNAKFQLDFAKNLPR